MKPHFQHPSRLVLLLFSAVMFRRTKKENAAAAVALYSREYRIAYFGTW